MNQIYYLGIPGSNSYTAAKNYFRSQDNLTGVETFAAIFQKVTIDTSSYGIIPIENTLGGSVVENYDLFDRFDVWISGEYYLKFENHLLAMPTNDAPEDRLEKINRVYSHPQPLLQCTRFFEKHPWMKKKAYLDTARAAQYVSGVQDPSLAAIANQDAAELFHLDIIKKNISDNPEANYTRFFIISSQKQDVPDANRASLLFTVPHVPGSLVRILQTFADNHINLVKIESRPIQKKPFEYTFHIDIAWEKDQEDQIEKLLKKFKKNTQTQKVLGFYKAASLPVQ
jgi:chorismate mutase/prephenate dehydratase